MLAVFAPLGTYIPGSRSREKKPVRGVVSGSMMCSAAELELSQRERRHSRSAGRVGEQIGERTSMRPVSTIR
jgi:tRNA-binding EMAP/Myf-like protein